VEPAQSSSCQYICIVTHARSGGTVLQRIMQSMPNTVFRGENEGAVVDMCNLLFKIQYLQKYGEKNFKQNFNDTKSPLYGANFIKFDSMIESFRRVFIDEILCVPRGVDYAGWKEHWFDPSHHGSDNIKKQFEILKMLFPGIKIIFNIRNPHDSSQSATLKNIKNSYDMINNYNNFYTKVHQDNFFNNNSILLKHEDWRGNPAYLYDQLSGFDLPVDLEKIKIILSEELVHMRNL